MASSVLEDVYDVQMLLDLPQWSLGRGASPVGLSAPTTERARPETAVELRFERDVLLMELLLNAPLPSTAPVVAAPTAAASGAGLDGTRFSAAGTS